MAEGAAFLLRSSRRIGGFAIIMIDQNLIAEVKERLRIDDAWLALGLPGHPAHSTRVPWREDKKPSLAIYDDSRRYFDHSQGRGGDVVAFVREATGWGFSDALHWCAARCGLAADKFVPMVSRQRAPARCLVRKTVPEPWPTLRAGSDGEREQLCQLRSFSRSAVMLCEARGLLHFGVYDAVCEWRRHWQGIPFWAVTDARRQFCELRMLSGELWPERDGSRRRKSHGLGTGKAFPCGLEEAATFPMIACVEGAPDLIAAHDLAMLHGVEYAVGVCAVLGAGVNRFAAECKHHFKGKHVRLFPHTDDAGEQAMEQWAQQIHDAGAMAVDAFALGEFTKLDGMPGKDLADLLRVHPASLAANPHLRTNLFSH